MKIGEKIEREIAERRWSQSELARSAKTTPPSISRIVNGAEPAAGLAFRIAKALSVPVDWLLDDARDWPPPSDVSGHSAGDCLDAAISIKRRTAAIYGALQTAFEGVSRAHADGDLEAAKVSARRLVDLCIEHAKAIEEWYRFATRWNGIVVYAAESPDWSAGARLERAIVELLGIETGEIPNTLRFWYSTTGDRSQLELRNAR